jgi:23S rRNA pseudouridine955/2504/2580 synthase
MSESDESGSRPKVRWLTVSEHHSGQRLDNYLQRELKGVPKTRLYRALRKGEVRVNKGRVKADYRLQEGDQVRIPPLRIAPAARPGELPRRWQTLLENNRLLEDRDLLVINKPSGLAVHGGSGLSFGLIEGLRLLRPEEPYLELVHRLDRDTSGCIMIARRAAMLKNLHRQLREDEVDKRYLALVAGSWPRKRQFVEAPLQKNTLQSGERLVRVERGGKAARTEFTVRERFAGYTLVEAKPITGRTHQIRVHALHAGFPILGDEKYGDRDGNQRVRSLGLKRLFLHAASLEFTNAAGHRQKVEAPLDNELQSFLEKISN